MKIVILSDIHDHIWNLEKVLEQIKDRVDAIIFCGDMCAPFTSSILAKANLPTYLVLGNNDEDHIGLMRKGGKNFEWIHLSQEFGETVLDSKRIAFCHYPKLGELLAKSGDYDAVFFGHTHKSSIKKYKKTLLVNPGAICGILEAKSGQAAYAIYNTENHLSKIVLLNN